MFSCLMLDFAVWLSFGYGFVGLRLLADLVV